jgi:hypothetical protein
VFFDDVAIDDHEKIKYLVSPPPSRNHSNIPIYQRDNEAMDY